MNIWLIQHGELLPLDATSTRMRTGLLATELVRRGHNVIWWASTFVHLRKAFVQRCDTEIVIEPRLRLKLLHVGGYRRNISLERVIHHKRLARRFAHAVRRMDRPDVIVVGFPIIEVAHAAVIYGVRESVPVVVDVRDLWPDSLVERFPVWTHAILRRLLIFDYRRTAGTLSGASSIVAVSRGCLDWALSMAGRSMRDCDRVFLTGYPRPGPDSVSVSERIQDTGKNIEGKVVFTFVGSFGYSYELELICNVASRIHRMGLDEIHFVLVGDGHQFREIQKRIAFLPNVTLTGWLNKPEIDAILARSDIGLVPCRSVSGTVSNKLMQYLAAGLPVVSSLEGEMKVTIREHEIGFSYSPGDADALLGHVVDLAKNTQLRLRMARNARELFHREFMAESIYSAYADHVERMCAAS